MSNFNEFQDGSESNTSYVPAAAAGQTQSKLAPRDPTFAPTAVVVTGVTLVFALVATALAGAEWGYHDVHGECNLINSDMQYIAQIQGCCPDDKKNGVACTGPAQAGFPSNMRDCLKKVCKKKSDIYFGQCHAPQLAIAGGVLGMVAALISAAGWHFDDWRRTITASVGLLGLASFFILGGAFVTSFLRFGNGNTDNRENIVMVGGDPTKWPEGPDCNYTYNDTRGDWKAMTSFCFLGACMSLVLTIHTFLWCNGLKMCYTESDASESNTSAAAGQMPQGSRASKLAPRDPTFAPTAVAVTTLVLIFGMLVTALAAAQWGFHDVHGECNLINSDMQYIAQIQGCCPDDKKNGAACTGPAQAGFPSNMRDCLKKVCKKSDDIYFGQCHAPQLAIAGGVLAMVAALISAAGWHFPDWRRVITASVGLLGLASFFILGGAFVTSFFRFGNGNTGNRENIVMVGGDPTKWPQGPNCEYTYDDTRGDWKAMTAFCFLGACGALVLTIHTCLWCNRLQLFYTQSGMELQAVEGVGEEFLKGSDADRGL